MSLTWFEKHPTLDAYRVGSHYAPYALLARDARFSDAELAAEYWQAETSYQIMRNLNGDLAVDTKHKASTLRRFATHPHFDQNQST